MPADYQQLLRLQRKLQRMEQKYEAFLRQVTKEIAARMLSKVIRRTPVANPSTWQTPVKGYVGGTLRRGWAVEANVRKKGNVYEIEVFNATDYAAYVEFGHRTANHQGWVKGRFMMTISADEVEQQAPALIERKLTQMLQEVFNGN